MASEAATIELPRAHAEQLLSTVGITRIIVVDDQYADQGRGVEDLIGKLIDADPGAAANLPHLEGISLDSDPDVWGDQLRAKWQELNKSQRLEVFEQAGKLQANIAPSTDDNITQTKQQGTMPVDDSRAAAMLGEILNGLENCKFENLSLFEWRDREKEILDSNDANSTLYLFDLDFRGEGASENEGIELVRVVQSRDVGYCGLITHTVSMGGEYEAWVTLADEHGLNKDKLVVIAKQRLTGESPDPYSFLRMLRLTALSGRCAVIKTSAWEIFEKSVTEVKAAMERLSILDFDQIVLTSSRREGVWEPDTLFRIFSILMRREARVRLYGNDADIRTKVAEARAISVVPWAPESKLGEEPPSGEALKIQRFELYETAEFLNSHCLPLDLGDVFEGGASRKKFILLAQPCDLMVRPEGRRSYDDKNGRSAVLLELFLDTPQMEVKPSWIELPFYDEGTGSSAYVDLAKAHYVRLAVLDACALNTEGEAEIDVDAECPSVATEPWKKRYDALRRIYRTALTRYEDLKDMRDELRQLSLPAACTSASFKAEVEGNIIRYELRRVARLNQPRSGALLTEFAHFQSRAAFEHDFDDRETIGIGGDDPEEGNESG